MKKAAFAALAAALALLLTGCGGGTLLPYAREMADMAMLRAMGLDAGEGRVELTVSTGRRSGGFDGERKDALVLSAGGKSIASACLAVQGLGDSYVFYGYVDQLLLGEELARQDITRALDYLLQSPELDLGVQLWTVRGSTARQALQNAGDGGAARRLSQLQTDGELGAAGISRTAGEVLTALADGGSTYLPVLDLVSAEEGDGGEGAEMVLRSGGYGVVRQGRLVCFLTGDAALGLELLEGHGAGRIADVELPGGVRASLRVDGTNLKCKAVFQGEELTGLEVLCTVEARVLQSGQVLKEDELEQLRRELERLEGERVVRALELSQYWDADFANLRRRAGLSDPAHWAAIRAQWEELFRSLDIRVEVRCGVERPAGTAG